MHQGYIVSNLFSNIYYIPKVLRDWIVVICRKKPYVILSIKTNFLFMLDFLVGETTLFIFIVR